MEILFLQGMCMADPPDQLAPSACTAEEVAALVVVAEEDPALVRFSIEGISDDCHTCVFTRTLRKGVDDVATSDIELCGRGAPQKASSAFATGACLTALVATAVAM